MIIRTRLKRTTLSLDLYLTDILGRLRPSSTKLPSAESYAPIVTASTPSSSKVTTPKRESEPPSKTSPPTTELVYNRPEDFLHDLYHNKIPYAAVNLEQFLVAHAWVMVTDNPPTLRRNVMVDGNVYEVTFGVRAVSFSEKASTIMGERH
jgi:hypothetical protein